MKDSTGTVNRQVRAAIWKAFPDCTHPLYGLWFVKSNKSPREALEDINHLLPEGQRDKHNLLVVQVGDETPLRDLDHVRRDPYWLPEHRIDALYTVLENATPRTH